MSIEGALIGSILGDALGMPYEFKSRKELDNNPVMDLVYKKAIITDDSSMTLCTIENLLENGNDLPMLYQKFNQWLMEGYWSFDGVHTIGMGMIVGNALNRIRAEQKQDKPEEGGLTGEMDNGNGSIMRIIPVILYNLNKSLSDMLHEVHKASRITHAHPRSQMGCGIYALFVRAFKEEKDKEKAYNRMIKDSKEYYGQRIEFEKELVHYTRILDQKIWEINRDEIQSTGYVVHTLEAAMWSIMSTDTFEEGILRAINLGDDADTVGAVAGGMAGYIYGRNTIPNNWVKKITRIEEIEVLIKKFEEKVTK